MATVLSVVLVKLFVLFWFGSLFSFSTTTTLLFRYLAEHLEVNKQDKSSRRGFEALAQKRRNLLLHLRKQNFETYKKVLQYFDIRDVKYINRDL